MFWRIAQLSRALRVSNEQRDKALGTMRLLEEPALKWYTMHETSASAQYDLGVLYLERSPIDAARWFRKSAEQGNAHAQLWLGDMYREGKGVKLDPVEAAKLYERAKSAS